MEQTALELTGDAAEPTLSVGQLTARVSASVRDAFPAQIWVRGEVQNLSRSRNGHMYFALVEKAGRGDRVQARIDCVLFADDRRAVERTLAAVPGAELGDDVEVRIRGRVAVYPAQGRLQLVMSTIDPVFTVGGIAANRERALRALAADGLLDANARFPLPLVPLRVGLVTSRGSAAYHDFVHELAASGYAWELSVFDVRVQGAAASRRIAYVLRELARSSIDVVVLARGGGARADLVPFDSELVARAIAAMPVPVLVGVGHETDRSVADAVAHSSCKTPTACAQLLVQRVRAFASHLDTVGIRIVGRARARGALAVRELDDVARRVRAVPAALSRERARLEQGRVRAIAVGRRRAADASRALGSHERTVTTLARHQLARAGLRLDAVEGRVHALDPARVLERGYTITRTADGRVVRRAGDAPVGAELVTELASGALVSRVESSRDREPPA